LRVGVDIVVLAVELLWCLDDAVRLEHGRIGNGFRIREEQDQFDASNKPSTATHAGFRCFQTAIVDAPYWADLSYRPLSQESMALG
jgi:hypothetical protein